MAVARRAASGDGRGSSRPRPHRAGAPPLRSPPVSPPGGAGRRPGLGSCTGNVEPTGVWPATGPGRASGGTMFSLKPPRPSFRSYLLPPPQVSARGSAGRPGPGRGAGERAPREPRTRWKLVELRGGGHSLAEVLRSLVLPCRDFRDSPELHFFPPYGASHRSCCDCQMVAAQWTLRRVYLSSTWALLKAAWAVVNMFTVRLSSR